MNKILTIALLTVMIGTVACQEEVAKELLMADYKVRYMEVGNQLDLQAKYKAIVPKVSEKDFLPVDGVDVFDKPMTFKSMQGYTDDYYSFKERMPFPKVIKFSFKNQEKQLIEQIVPFQPIRNISIDREFIQRDSGFYLVWEGDTLSRQDELRLIFDYKTEQPVRMNLIGGSSFKRVFIRKEQIRQLKEGKVKISLIQRRYEKYPNNAAVLGSYVIEYYHKPIEIEVK